MDDDPYPTDSDTISSDEPDSPVATCFGGIHENRTCVGMTLANYYNIPQERATPRPKQTARKSSARKPAAKAQTARKQTARESQSSGKSTKSTPTPTKKAKAKPKPKAKTQGAQKKAPAKKKSEPAEEGPASQGHDIVEFQCRVIRANGLPN